MGMYDYRRYYKTFVTVTEDGEIRLGKYRDARNRYGWVIVGALQWMQPEYELDEEGNIFRTLWGKKRILYTSDQIRQAVDRAKRMKRRLAWLDTLLREIEEPQQAGA
ncbi:MAG: hypothetical protein ACOX1Y_11490 [Zhaonellaceae bacterium]